MITTARNILSHGRMAQGPQCIYIKFEIAVDFRIYIVLLAPFQIDVYIHYTVSQKKKSGIGNCIRVNNNEVVLSQTSLAKICKLTANDSNNINPKSLRLVFLCFTCHIWVDELMHIPLMSTKPSDALMSNNFFALICLIKQVSIDILS